MKKVLLQVKTKKSNIIYCYVLLSLVFLMNNAFSVISIDTIEKLSKIGKDPDYPMDGEYEITQDIDARETLTWNLNTGFESIGSENNRFMGKLNGNNHVIWGLYINSPKLNYKGLFGSIGNTAVISNLGLQDVNISGRYYVGGITAQNYGGKIENCFVIGGSISGESSVGGIVGDNYGQVYECYSIVKIIGSKNNSSNIGGLIGYNNQMGSIVYCYSAGYINASGTYIGGLIGANGNRTMENTSYWDIDVSGQTTSAHGIGKNSSEMRKMSTFVDWDFVNCWQIKENVTYPYFVNQNVFIPNLEQKDKDESITLLNNQYLVIAEITQQCSNDIPQNKVISSSPGFGEVIFQGNTVSLLVSTGPCSEGEGIIEGEGVLEGVLEGTSEGEGVLEGVLEGISEGEGAQEGEGITEGTTEGILEGEGVIEGEGLFDPCHIEGCEEVCDDVLGESHFEEDLRWLYGLAGVNADTADLDRNGMLDVVQAWLLDEVLRDKGYVVHCCVKIVYRKNVEASKAYADAIKEVKPAVFLIIDRTK
ncbi:MAG TPA: PASTA domain-containing protein, partial [Candidatus Hydrogenedens sp.]|nr:PASTA domain-containing protein [Candidatus Hydrogenedens sp.]